MRQRLQRILGPQARVEWSLVPGRRGYVVTSKSLSEGLRPCWRALGFPRLVALHAESGRFLLVPSRGALGQALSDPSLDWWSDRHQQAAGELLAGWRGERIRRRPPFSRPPRGCWVSGFVGLALRLDFLSVTPRPDKHWAGLAREWDALWRHHSLARLAKDPLGPAVWGYLQRCQLRFQEVSEDYG